MGTIHDPVTGDLAIYATAISIWGAMPQVSQLVLQFISPFSADRFGLKFNMWCFTILMILVSPWNPNTPSPVRPFTPPHSLTCVVPTFVVGDHCRDSSKVVAGLHPEQRLVVWIGSHSTFWWSREIYTNQYAPRAVGTCSLHRRGMWLHRYCDHVLHLRDQHGSNEGDSPFCLLPLLGLRPTRFCCGATGLIDGEYYPPRSPSLLPRFCAEKPLINLSMTDRSTRVPPRFLFRIRHRWSLAPRSSLPARIPR